MGRAPSMSEVQRNGNRYPHGGREEGYPGNSSVGGRVAYPSNRFRTYTEGNILRVSVPDNWRELPDQNSVWFAPEGGYGQSQQNSPVFTHGAEIGFSSAQSNDLQRETQQFVSDLARSNQNLRQQNGFTRGNISGRNALAIKMSNVNEATGRRKSFQSTALLRNGGMFHMITVAPEENNAYQNVFQSIVRSIQIND
jgi:hypothetical protein